MHIEVHDGVILDVEEHARVEHLLIGQLLVEIKPLSLGQVDHYVVVFHDLLLEALIAHGSHLNNIINALSRSGA